MPAVLTGSAVLILLAVAAALVARWWGIRRGRTLAHLDNLKEVSRDLSVEIDEQTEVVAREVADAVLVHAENERQAAERAAAKEARQADAKADPTPVGSVRRLGDLLRRRRTRRRPD